MLWGSDMRHLARLCAAAAVLSSSGVAAASSPEANDTPPRAAQPTSTDALFPRNGGFNATFATGLPFLGIGELAYGFGDRFALGAIAAATPNVGSIRGTMAFGLRPRGVLFASGAWRSVITVPVLYYPEVSGFGGDLEPWVLARPTLSLEHELPGGASVSVALGAIAAACTEGILTLGEERTMMGGVWNTAGIGGAIPLSGRATLFGEASLVMRGVEPARDWIGGAPVVAIVGLATTL